MMKSAAHPRRSGVQTHSLGRRILRCAPLYMLLLPAIVYFILIKYVPIAGNVLAFKNYSYRKGIWGSPWVGLKYFRTFFTSYDCWRLIGNTFRIGMVKCLLEFSFPVILALLLNEVRSPRFKRVTQTISYLPHFLSTVVVVTMMQRILAPNTGMLNQIISALGGDGSTFFLMKAQYFDQILFLMDTWMYIGWDSIIYLAAISNIDQQLYEAAQIDGCNRFKSILHVTIPGILGTVCLLLIMNVGGLLSSGVSQMWLLRTPGNMAVADTLDVYVLRTGLQNGQFGYASAIGLIQGVVGLVLVVATNSISKRVADVGLW